ncbi:hypothetical protein B0T10DRAFT_431808 [Thelonectria olida]|uniref:NACHT domain-containing protein n=1 Tax=Thelonectria olida TaxID=1576542 RepID=A0A9P8WIQ8_9HYPO|nr:hypothetical protein B0T10DRAFT_431808 [Thelonectria olida]
MDLHQSGSRRTVRSFFSKIRTKRHASDPAQPPDSAPSSPTSSVARLTLTEQPRSETAPTPPSDAEPDSATLHETLWNQAYDGLKGKEPDIVEAYEKILTAKLKSPDSTDASGKCPDNDIGQTQGTRSSQMQKLVRIGLDRTEKVAKIKGKVDARLQIVDTIKGAIDHSLKAAPEAAVVWAGVCIGLEILANPMKEPGINRKGLTYVLSRMNWYWTLADLLLDENKARLSTTALQHDLKTHVVELYKKLLLYQMQSACLYYRNWASVLLRDAVKLDDWDGKITEIKDAEALIKTDAQQYNTEEIKLSLKEIEKATPELQAVYSAIQDQTQCQEARYHDEKDKQCLKDLLLTDPEEDKDRIEDTKGGLLKDSYHWILEHDDYKRFLSDTQSRLLWIRGDPGKGKTMLLCGIIDELKKDSQPLSYFFCQATEADLASEMAVLRGLIYLLIQRQPSLISFIRSDYDKKGKNLFEGINSSIALSKILKVMLQDPSVQDAILVVDALDECTRNRDRLIKLIIELSGSGCAKWIISSRNWPEIEDQLWNTQKVRVQLELNSESISSAVQSYIQKKVNDLAREKRYNEALKNEVYAHLASNADDTFLWVALVCQRLAATDVRKFNTLTELKKFPSGLSSFYRLMMQQISSSSLADVLKSILATVCIVHRPVTMGELKTLVGSLESYEDDDLEYLIGSCGSFLTHRNGVVYFVHQSAKDFLLQQGHDNIFPSGTQHRHREVCINSLKAFDGQLKRDIYGLKSPGCLINEVSRPASDPLYCIAYSCTHWAHHLIASDVLGNDNEAGLLIVLGFFKEKLVFWLEALSLLRRVSLGAKAIADLETALGQKPTHQLMAFVQDTRRFILHNKWVIESAPLQTYASALIFSPRNSLIRRQFHSQEPVWIAVKPETEEDWDDCLQTLHGHRYAISCINFSSDGRLLVSGSFERELKIWDAISGDCLQILNTAGEVKLVAFSPDGKRIVAGLLDGSVEVWDSATGVHIQTFEAQRDVGGPEAVSFLPDGKKLVLGFCYGPVTVKAWDLETGVCANALEAQGKGIRSLVFSPDGKQLAKGSRNGTIEVWSLANRDCIQTLSAYQNEVSEVSSIAYSSDGKHLGTGSDDGTVRVWDLATGICIRLLKGHTETVISVAFLQDNRTLVSSSYDKTIKLWDDTGSCVKTLHGHYGHYGVVHSLSACPTRQQLVSSSGNAVKIWEFAQVSYGRKEADSRGTKATFSSPAPRQDEKAANSEGGHHGNGIGLLGGHTAQIKSLTFSPDGTMLASRSADSEIKMWDARTGSCILNLPSDPQRLEFTQTDWVSFAQDCGWFALRLPNQHIGIWDRTSNTPIRTITRTNQEQFRSLTLSPDGKYLALCEMRNLNIWDVAQDKVIRSFNSEWRPPVFSGNSRLLAMTKFRQRSPIVLVYDMLSGDCVSEFSIAGNDSFVQLVAFSLDCQWLAYSQQSTGTIVFQQWATGSRVESIGPGHPALYDLQCDMEANVRFATELGILDLGKPGQDTSFAGYGVSFDKSWIIRGKERVLWIPPEFRTLAFTDVGFKVAMSRSTTGRIMMTELV